MNWRYWITYGLMGHFAWTRKAMCRWLTNRETKARGRKWFKAVVTEEMVYGNTANTGSTGQEPA